MMSSEELYYCESCQAGPWGMDVIGHNEIKIVNFHIEKGHKVVKYVEQPVKKNSLESSIDVMMDMLSGTQKYRDADIEKREKEKGKPIEQIENYLNSVIREDPILVKQILRVYLSAYTKNPINMALLAPSSDGKTWATVQVSKLFPKEDVILVGSMTPKALIHQQGILVDENMNPLKEKIDDITFKIIEANKAKQTDVSEALKQELKEIHLKAKHMVNLENKILLFLDNPNPATYEMLKPIMSHDNYDIIYKTTKGDGSLSVKESVIRGWPSFIFCSAKNEAKNEVWAEIVTRVFMASPNSSVKKYREANKYTSLKKGIPSWASSMYKNEDDEKYAKFYISEFRDNFVKLHKVNDVPYCNPFYQILSDLFPNNEGPTMRHFTRLMDFIAVETLINFNTNPKMIFDTKDGKRLETVFTTIQNIGSAVEILGNISSIPPEKIKFYEKIFMPLWKEEYPNLVEMDELPVDIGLTSVKLAKKYVETFKKDQSPKQIIENYCEILVDSGILQAVPNPLWVKQNLYQPIKNALTAHNIKDLKSTLIDTVDILPLYILPCLESIQSISIDFRKSDIQYDWIGKKIDLVELSSVIFGNQSTLSLNTVRHENKSVDHVEVIRYDEFEK
jgi:hypothetical protein